MKDLAASGLEPGESLALELTRVQRQIEMIYQLEPTPPIAPFVRIEADATREQLIVRQSADFVEIIVLLSEASLEALITKDAVANMDAYLEAIEGISHFIHIAERTRTELPTTLLELELQAEVDKFAILTAGMLSLPAEELFSLHRRLYEDVRFLHASATERGQRYRLANGLAAKLWSQLINRAEDDARRETLRRFYRASQAEKIRMVLVA